MAGAIDFTIPSTQAPARSSVRTFDVFDTLIARRCIEPHRVFAAVAAAMDRPGFPEERIAAEQAVWGGPYTLADIYGRLAHNSGLEPAYAEQLMQAEIDAELEEVIPIAENLALVSDGDLLISDMYLPADTIRALLDRAGLQKNIGLFVSAHGKRSGDIWPKVAAQFSVEEHLGDNAHADVDMPRRFGLTATHTGVAAPSHVEQWLLGLGLHDLAGVLREARLRTWHENPVLRRLQLTQVQLNLPILILSSLRLARLADRLGAERILFASRDCNMWLALFQAMAGSLNASCEPVYFYTSRHARLNASDDYLQYARDALAKRSIIADVCGTGWSMSNLLATLNLSDQCLFFTHWMQVTESYLAHSPLQATCTVDAVVQPSREGVSNVHLEMCNYAEHGSVKDVKLIAGAAVPVFDADRRSPSIKAAVAEQRRAFSVGVDVLRRHPLQQSLSLSDDVISELVAQLYLLLSRDTLMGEVFGQAHYAEDALFMNSLRPRS